MSSFGVFLRVKIHYPFTKNHRAHIDDGDRDERTVIRSFVIQVWVFKQIVITPLTECQIERALTTVLRHIHTHS